MIYTQSETEIIVEAKRLFRELEIKAEQSGDFQALETLRSINFDDNIVNFENGGAWVSAWVFIPLEGKE